MLDKQM